MAVPLEDQSPIPLRTIAAPGFPISPYRTALPISNELKIVSVALTEKRGQRATESKVLDSTADRPDYNAAVKLVQTAGREAQRAAAQEES